MIASLRGILREKQPTRLVVETGGVGLEVHVSLATSRAVGDEGEEVFLHTTLVVREDALTLYGFSDPRERVLFLKLIGVSGVGPKTALAALSGASVEGLAAALRGGDTSSLTRIPGIGRKTAERMIVELKDTVVDLAGAEDRPAGDRVSADATAALVSLGYGRGQAEKAVREVLREGDGAPDLEVVLRAALVRLTGG